MNPHALVIDDDPEILEEVRDRLESLGHSCDCADCQEAARACLPQRAYDYILLDMEIPIKYGRPTRVQNGKNLLREIRATEGFEEVQIVVITAHGRDGPELATEVLRGRYEGADDFVNKPFPTQGHTLEKAILDALVRAGQLTGTQGDGTIPVDLRQESNGLHWVVGGNDTGRLPKGTLTAWSQVLFENMDKDYFVPHEVFRAKMKVDSETDYWQSHKQNRSKLRKFIEFDYDHTLGMRLSRKYVKSK